jgi:hypothetical protein
MILMRYWSSSRNESPPGSHREREQIRFSGTRLFTHEGELLTRATGQPGPLNSRFPLRLLFDVGGEADAAAVRWGWVHQLADRREDGADGLIVLGEFFVDPGFELCKSPGEFLG